MRGACQFILHNMSLARNLVDLYVLTSAVSKVSASALASQASSVCQHVKTSSLLNPTPIIKEVQIENSPERQQQQQEMIEVPFNNLAVQDNTTSIPTTSNTVAQAQTTITNTKQMSEISINKQQHLVEDAKVDLVIKETQADPLIEKPAEPQVPETRRQLKESRIPTSRLSRLWNYGTLATSMGLGAMNESLKRATGISNQNSGT